MKLKARIIEKDTLEQMYNIRYNFHTGSQAGKMDWELIDIEIILESLADDGVMTFTQKFGEVGSGDRDKIQALLK
jgi:hypothetical protein